MSDMAPDNPCPARRQPATAGEGAKQSDHSDSHRPSVGTRPPDYVIVVAASDWVKAHFPAAGANLLDALHPRTDSHRRPRARPRSRTITQPGNEQP